MRAGLMGLFGGINPSRRATRCTCVSTGSTSSPKPKRSTSAAVLRPIPGSATSQSRAWFPSGHSARNPRSHVPSVASLTSASTCWMRRDLVGARPPARA